MTHPANQKSVALVTGASSGIGATYAHRLAERGMNLILVARRRDRLEQLSSSLIDRFGVKVETIVADLADPHDLSTVAKLVDSRPNLEMLVNNAGLGALGASSSVDPQSVLQLVRVNVLALTMLCLAASPRFREAGRGAIINIGSNIAFKASPGAPAYCASKAYVLAFTRSMQAEFAGTNVKVQLVMPGPVRTEFFGDAKAPLPEHLFMSPEDLVDCAMVALDRGELICFPHLQDTAVWARYENVREELVDALHRTGLPASRYGLVTEAAP